MISKKALGPVVATALLLVVSVVAVVGFQTWFQGYSSSLFTESEEQSSDLSTGVENVFEEKLYFKSGKDNLSITKIEVGGEDCNYETSLERGISQIDISSCLESIPSGSIQEAVVYTNQGVYSESFLVSDNVGYSIEPSLSGFITVWNTSIAGSTSSNQLKLPLREGGIYDFVVDWDDGTTDTITSWDQAETLHTYDEEGVYTVNITGVLQGFGVDKDKLGFEDNVDDGDKLLEIQQWDNVILADGGRQFYGAENFQITATDTPDLSSLTDLSGIFYGASIFNSNINDWNVSSINSLKEAFRNTLYFNQSLDNWDTTSVTDMSYMFTNAFSFNQPINSWNTSKVENMGSLFSQSLAFDQPLDNWDTSNVLNMRAMFSQTDNFNQNISMWNVSSVTNMEVMFYQVEAFNQNLSGWDVSSVTTCTDFDLDATSWVLSNSRPALDSDCLS